MTEPDQRQRAPEETPRRAVLDASAVLAFLQEEPGTEEVESRLDGSVLPSVNLAEVLARITADATDDDAAEETIGTLHDLGVHIEPIFSPAHAATAARLHRTARHLGLSLGDRACLAVTAHAPAERYALTADQAWTRLPAETDITVVAIR
jgi:PIN domain nuclease of toxin-antitoxin system